MRVQEYLEAKRIKAKNYPKMYVVKSTREGVSEINTRFVNEVQEFENHYKYLLDKSDYPFEVRIDKGKNFYIDDGYGTGVGDLWYWTYFSSTDEDLCKKFAAMELNRINTEYKKK